MHLRLLMLPSPMQESCGGNLSIGLQSVITIESPNYPLNYFKKTVCKWLITGPLNTYVRISFTNFSTEPFYDRIELYQGTSCYPNITQLATLSGKRDELAFTQCDSLSNSLLVEFRTDSLISDTGFRANILVAQTRQKQSKLIKVIVSKIDRDIELYIATFFCLIRSCGSWTGRVNLPGE